MSFEENKAGWVHSAATTIATYVYHLLLTMPPTAADPTKDFLDQCIDNALAILELDQSNHDKENFDMDAMSPPPLDTLVDESASAPPTTTHLQGSLPSPSIHDLRGSTDHVDIPNHTTDVEPSPRF